jgi:hypothetical protein
MASLGRRHRRLVGQNIDDEVDVPGRVAIEAKKDFENIIQVADVIINVACAAQLNTRG